MMRPCRCGKHMLEAANEGTCVWCGYGEIVVLVARSRRTPRLPQDLGEIAREGRHPDPWAENVVRLDRLHPPAQASGEDDAEMAA